MEGKQKQTGPSLPETQGDKLVLIGCLDFAFTWLGGLTSKSDQSDVTDCVSYGIQGYIVKPFKPKEIAERILECYAQTKPEHAKAAQELLKKSKELENVKKRYF